MAPTVTMSLRPARYPRYRRLRSHNSRPGFILAYGLVSMSGITMGLLLGWVMWG